MSQCALVFSLGCVWIAGHILVETSWPSVGVSSATQSRNMTHEATTAFFERTGAEFEESSAGKVSRIPQGETASEGAWCLSLAALHDRKTKGRREVAIEPNIRRQGQ